MQGSHLASPRSARRPFAAGHHPDIICKIRSSTTRSDDFAGGMRDLYDLVPESTYGHDRLCLACEDMSPSATTGPSRLIGMFDLKACNLFIEYKIL